MFILYAYKIQQWELVTSLEEFGLPKYEAKAYLTMIDKGSLSASEIAYYLDLPRTKVYPTLRKLKKKKLSEFSSNNRLFVVPSLLKKRLLALLSS